jgi:hypothetical protein
MDIDSMLYEDMLWFARQAEGRTLEEFKRIVIDLDQKNWDRFWKIVTSMANKKLCIINGGVKELTAEEMEVAELVLGKPQKQECWVY